MSDVATKTAESDEKAKTLKETTEEWGLVFTSAMEDAIVNGGNLGDIFTGLINDIIRMTIRTLILKPLLDSMGGSGGIGGFITSLFAAGAGAAAGGGGGGRPTAGGGNIQAGSATVVGERGPELIMPNAPMRVLNNHSVSRGGGGGNTKIEIINRGTPQQAVGSSSTSSPEGMITKIFLNDLKSNGKMATGIQSSFGVRRQ